MLDIELSLLELVARFVIIIFNNLMTPKTGLPHISIDSFLRFDSHLMCDGEEWIIYLPNQLLQEFKVTTDAAIDIISLYLSYSSIPNE